jgi:2-amino-4-hydroxy-6-hydroxymethyldihydropteridine diphosphokinase
MDRPAVTAYVGLGANLGEAAQTVQEALSTLDASPGLRLLQASGLYRTAPVGAGGPDYINAVAAVATRLNAPDLLGTLQSIEQHFGRQRPYRNAPRTLDLDLLLYGSARMDSCQLTVPHPRMWERAFVLVPLHEIAPQRVSRESLFAVAAQALAPYPAPGQI